ncbi:MAG TPA: hypothetical protein VEA99_08245 [Gemmatimonadaceae bacterium]|nr:hypothetical protein [Gemmatimonadaceae bacterium]
MAFLVSTQTLSQAWEDAQNIARATKNAALAQRTASLAGPVPATSILHFERELRSYRDRLQALAALPGIAAYVTGLANTPAGYDVTAEFNAMQAQIAATINWIRTNFPRDAGGYLLERQWAADGLTDRTFTTAALAGYRTQLDALLAALG